LPFACIPPFDPANADQYSKFETDIFEYLAEEIFICIPAYNEGKDAFLRTIGSITNSNYPKEKLYMLFIVDGNRQHSFEAVMEVLLGTPWTGTIFTFVINYGLRTGKRWQSCFREWYLCWSCMVRLFEGRKPWEERFSMAFRGNYAKSSPSN
jgi:cellulose synthase/poly-beta-1,6-N-acetylglucosamine synthase-like glycosyltransferase